MYPGIDLMYLGIVSKCPGIHAFHLVRLKSSWIGVWEHENTHILVKYRTYILGIIFVQSDSHNKSVRV